MKRSHESQRDALLQRVARPGIALVDSIEPSVRHRFEPDGCLDPRKGRVRVFGRWEGVGGKKVLRAALQLVEAHVRRDSEGKVRARAISYGTQARTPGPNVVLGLTARGSRTELQPHQRWATGLLVDGAVVDSSIDLMNRGYYGSGHGWTIGFGVERLACFLRTPRGASRLEGGSRGASFELS